MLDPDLSQELLRRRNAVLNELGDGALVLFSAPVARRNNDVEHPYRQHSDFYYLTGFEEPDAALVLRKQSPSLVMFVRERNPEREQWEGRRAGIEGAVADYGAAEAHPMTEFDSRLADLLEGVPVVAYLLGEEDIWDKAVFGAINTLKSRRRKRVESPHTIVDAAPLLHGLRRKKSAFEVVLLEQVAELSARAHCRAMRVCQAEMYEYQLQAELESVFRHGGAPRVAYESIVGSGENATILHYRENNRRMRADELVLIDAGAELGYMAADITRTFPVGGKFSPQQRELYDLVLAAHAAAVEQARPGRTLDDVHQAAHDVLKQGLIELGWIDAAADAALQDTQLRRYFMHRTSHYLGMDVHDVGPYHVAGALLPLEPGVVITVEPGLYVSSGDEAAPEEYWNIGIRIEDDVLVEESGPRLLTGGVPRLPDEIEALCGTLAGDVSQRLS